MFSRQIAALYSEYREIFCMLDKLRRYTGSQSQNKDEKGISDVHGGCISVYTYIKANNDIS